MRNWLMIILHANTDKLITGIQQWKAVVAEEEIIVDSCLLGKKLLFEVILISKVSGLSCLFPFRLSKALE